MSKLPEGLALPGVFGQVLVFATKLPAMMLPLQSLAVTTCTTASSRQSSASGWPAGASILSSVATYWPVLTALFLSAALIETLCRQWVWYRLLENKVLVNFRHSDQGLFGRIRSDRGVLWLLGGWVLLGANEVVNSPSDQTRASLLVSIATHELNGTIFGLLMMYVFFVTEAESSQLPTVNACLKSSKDDNVAWLQASKLVDEAAVAEACCNAGVAFGPFYGWPAVADLVSKQGHTVSSGQGFLYKGLGVERVMGHSFWAMQTLGLPPASGAFSGYQRLRLQHDEADHKFASSMRV